MNQTRIRGIGLCRVFALLIGLAILSGGCGGSAHDETLAPNDEGMPAEAIAVRQAFDTAEPAVRKAVKETLGLVAMGKSNPRAYSEAMPQLKALAAYEGITPEQKEALQTLMRAINEGTLQ